MRCHPFFASINISLALDVKKSMLGGAYICTSVVYAARCGFQGVGFLGNMGSMFQDLLRTIGEFVFLPNLAAINLRILPTGLLHRLHAAIHAHFHSFALRTVRHRHGKPIAFLPRPNKNSTFQSHLAASRKDRITC